MQRCIAHWQYITGVVYNYLRTRNEGFSPAVNNSLDLEALQICQLADLSESAYKVKNIRRVYVASVEEEEEEITSFQPHQAD